MSLQSRERIAVTGVGAVSGFGWSAAELWDGLLAGRTSIAPTRRFDTSGQRTHVAAEVPPVPERLREVSAFAARRRA